LRYLLLIAIACIPAVTAADQREDFESALAKWQATRINRYTFVYEEGGAVVVAPKCGGMPIRVRVRDGVSTPPVVVKGDYRCPAGTRGRRLDVTVPKTVDDAFASIRRYIFDPPTRVRVTVAYDANLGVPISYYVEKLDFYDNDEGIKITKFSVD
jgi:hypothetical protein